MMSGYAKPWAMVAAFGLVAMACPAKAGVLLDLTDQPGRDFQSYQLTFTADSAVTYLSFAGYNVPNGTSVSSIGLFMNNVGGDILATVTGSYQGIPASRGSLFAEFGDGALVFSGTAEGFYDIMYKAVPTDIGAAYTVRFDYGTGFVPGETPSNGFRVAVSNAAPVAVPEPAAWILMAAGFGVIGWGARRRRQPAGRITA